MRDTVIVSLLSLAPRKRGARTMGWLARSRVSKWAVRWFVRRYRIDLSEANDPIESFATLEALFTRALRPGARPVAADPGAIVSPVDGVVAFVGRTENGRVPVAPRRFMELSRLLGEAVEGELDAVVIYLSPRDYHRVHVPREGSVTRFRYVAGTLWPVFPAAVKRVRGLYERNERVCVRIETEHGPLHVVLVGAFGVGRITLSFTDLVTNAGKRTLERTLTPSVSVERGGPLGVFHLGSTVVLAAPPGRWRFSVSSGDRVRVGAEIGRTTSLLSGPTCRLR